MAFKFKLEKVLEFRVQLEEQAMQALAEATKQHQKAQITLENQKHDLKEQSIKANDAVSLSSAERWLIQSYIKALHVDIEYSTKQVNLLSEKVSSCQHDLLLKAQDKKLLEKLKDKQAKRYADEEKLKEQRQYDENSTIRYQKETL